MNCLYMTVKAMSHCKSIFAQMAIEGAYLQVNGSYVLIQSSLLAACVITMIAFLILYIIVHIFNVPVQNMFCCKLFAFTKIALIRPNVEMQSLDMFTKLLPHTKFLITYQTP